jgi:hypothetical protein
LTLFDTNLLFDGRSIRKEKDRIKEKNRREGWFETGKILNSEPVNKNGIAEKGVADYSPDRVRRFYRNNGQGPLQETRQLKKID